MSIPLEDEGQTKDPLFNGNGQYRIPTPEGKILGHTRASNIAKELDRTEGLHIWRRKWDAHTYAQRKNKDLLDLAKGHHPDEDHKVYGQIIDTAERRAATDDKANTGTALHRFCEQIDQGHQPAAVSPDWCQHLAAYQRRIADAPFELVDQFTEMIVVDDNFRLAGRIDRVGRITSATTVRFPDRTVTLEPGTLIDADIKTGKIDGKGIPIGIQQTVYANHTATFDHDPEHPDNGTRLPRIDLNREVAAVIHLPAASDPAECHIVWIDLIAGLDCFETAMAKRGLHRDQRKMWSTDVTSDTIVNDAAAEWIRERLRTVAAHDRAAGCMQRQWPLLGPAGELLKFPEYPDPETVAMFGDLLDRVEREYELPIAPSAPLTATTP